MTQPTFVPISEADQVRPARHLHVPEAWTTNRPAELRTPTAWGGKGVGTPGSDAGFALRLVRRFAHDLKLEINAPIGNPAELMPDRLWSILAAESSR